MSVSLAVVALHITLVPLPSGLAFLFLVAVSSEMSGLPAIEAVVVSVVVSSVVAVVVVSSVIVVSVSGWMSDDILCGQLRAKCPSPPQRKQLTDWPLIW